MMELMTTCFAQDGFCEHEESIFREPCGNPALYFSKQPTDIRYIKKVFLLDANLYVLYLFRDPRDVITSVHKSKPDHYFCNYRIWKECHDASRQFHNHPRFLAVSYEDLTSQPDQVQRRISDQFRFLEKKHPFADYQKFANPSGASETAMSGLRPISSDHQQRWKEHLPRVKAQWKKYPELADVLVECGYEPDRRWLESLKQVTEKDFPCRYPEKVSNFKRWETNLRKYFQTRSYLARHSLAYQPTYSSPGNHPPSP
jgi:hypothetical protein